MAYKLICWKSARQSPLTWTGKFGAAKDHAVELVKSGAADRVDIYDELHRLRYHYPRTMRRA